LHVQSSNAHCSVGLRDEGESELLDSRFSLFSVQPFALWALSEAGCRGGSVLNSGCRIFPPGLPIHAPTPNEASAITKVSTPSGSVVLGIFAATKTALSATAARA